MQALFGRHGESPIAVIAPFSPTDCFDAAFEAVRVAIKYMTPVFVLSDGFLANGSKPWKIPSFADLPSIPGKHWTENVGFHPYLRDEDTLSRPWVVPGTPGLEHRIGGLEKDYDSGNISYLAANHDRMARVRATKIARIADDLEPVRAMGSPDAEVLVVGWGSTFGSNEAWSFLPVLADREHHLSAAGIGSIIMLGVLLSGIIQVPLGAMADRVNKRAMICCGGLVVSLALAVLGWSRGRAGLTGASILFGVGGGISMAAHVALSVQKGSRADAMGSVMAILTVAHSMGMMVGAVIAGLMMDIFSLQAVFPLGAGIMLGCTLAFFWGYGRTGQAPGQAHRTGFKN